MIARNARDGFGFVQSTLAHYHPKFHPLSFLTVLAGNWVADELFLSKVIFVLGGVLTVALAAKLAERLFDRPTALLTAYIIAVAPVTTTLLQASISHSLYLPLYVGALLFLWNATLHGSSFSAAIAGALVGLSWWARPDGLLVFPFLGIFLLGGVWSRYDVRTSLRTCASFGGSFLALYAAYICLVEYISAGATVAHGPLFDFLSKPLPCVPSRDPASYSSFLSFVVHEP
ncbi:hypothetical protein D6833_12080, partial [Candidatus Parcubacteria bacterium]